MRSVQNLLLIVGVTAFGAACCGLGVTCYLMGQSAGARGIAGVGAAGLAMLLYAAGTGLGAMVGFATAVWWVMTREIGPWKTRVWCGVAVGMLISLALYGISNAIDSSPPAGVPESGPIVLARAVIDPMPGGTELAEMIAGGRSPPC